MAHIAEDENRLQHKGVTVVGDEGNDTPLSKLLVKHDRGTKRHGKMDGTHDKSGDKRRKISTSGAQNDNGKGVHVKMEGANVESYESMKSSTRSKISTSGAQNDKGTAPSKQVLKGIRGSGLDAKRSSKRQKESSGKRRTKPKQSRQSEPSKRNDGDVRDTAFRSSLNGIRTLIKELPLREEHKEIMKKTPFWQLFDAVLENKLTSELCRKSDLMVIKMINAYDPATDGFILGPDTYKITRGDIANLFGIRDGTEKVFLKQGSRDAVKMVSKGFVVEERLSSSSIKEVTKKYATRVEEEYIPVVVSLLCAYLLHSLFFPTGTTVRWAFLERVEDLDQINKYDWCGAIVDELMSSIRRWHTEPRKVSGCVLVLLYWLCEHTNLVTPLNPDEPLGVIKWRTTDLVKEFLNSSLEELDPDKVLTNHRYRSEDPLRSTPEDGGGMEASTTLGDEPGFDQRRNVKGAWEQFLGLEHSGTLPKRVNAGNQLHRIIPKKPYAENQESNDATHFPSEPAHFVNALTKDSNDASPVPSEPTHLMHASSKESNGSTHVPSKPTHFINASNRDSNDATAPCGKVRFLSYWISSEASLVLKKIHGLHKETFVKFSVTSRFMQTGVLESFALFVEWMLTAKVNELNEEALHHAFVSVKEFEQVGLDLSWLNRRLEEVESVNKLSKACIYVESCETSLKQARAKVYELKEVLAKATEEAELMSRESPESLGADDLVLEGVL